jgi:hypothetical protein
LAPGQTVVCTYICRTRALFLFAAGLGAKPPGCGVSDSVQSWMDEVRHSGEKTELPVQPATQPSAQNDDDGELGPQYKYSQVTILRILHFGQIFVLLKYEPNLIKTQFKMDMTITYKYVRKLLGTNALKSLVYKFIICASRIFLMSY